MSSHSRTPTERPLTPPRARYRPAHRTTYAYVNGDPVNLSDPTGHNPCRNDDCDALTNYELAASDRSGGSAATWSQLSRYATSFNATISERRTVIANARIAYFRSCYEQGAGLVDGRCEYLPGSVGRAVEDILQSPIAQWMADHPTAVGVINDIAAATVSVAATGTCTFATGGAGTAGCIVAGGALGGAVGGALNCPDGDSTTACAVKGGLVGAAAAYVGGKAGALLRPFLGRIAARGAAGATLPEQAVAARNALANAVGAGKATVTGGYNVDTGRIAAGFSGGPLGCAEHCVVDLLGGDAAKIRFTQAIRPRTGLEVPICAACQAIYSPDQFPVGTQFDEGPWLPWWRS